MVQSQELKQSDRLGSLAGIAATSLIEAIGDALDRDRAG
jgi:hypothetical protein